MVTSSGTGVPNAVAMSVEHLFICSTYTLSSACCFADLSKCQSVSLMSILSRAIVLKVQLKDI